MFQALAGLLAFFYDLVPSYGVAIALLTLAVMLVLTPLTWKSTRSMLEMQRLQPEIRKLQQQHRNDRQKLNEEMMKFYREHQVNPVAGCLPMLLQMPVLIIMYRVISGLTSTSGGRPEPKYLSQDTQLYQDLVSDGGRMVSFGMDLAKTAASGHAGFLAALPFFVLIALVVITQYVQTKQMSGRNPSQQQNPQMVMMQRVMPAFFGFISFSLPAGVNLYFLASSLFRIVQQELMYRFDPVLVAHVKEQAREVEAKAYDTKGKDEPRNGKASAPAADKRNAGKNGGRPAQGKGAAGKGAAGKGAAGKGAAGKAQARRPKKGR